MLFKRRTILLPTIWGWCLIGLLLFVPTALWVVYGETFMARSAPRGRGALVVEGWIGAEAIAAARREFDHGGYQYVIATGNISGEPWHHRRWSYAAEAEEQLLRMGIPREKVIVAPPREIEVHRTFESAAAVRRTMESRNIKPDAIDVFTRASHGRRSRLIYAKVFSGYCDVGVISWMPATYREHKWWNSSERSLELIKESGGYLFELLLNGGRRSNSANIPAAGMSSGS